MICEKCGKELPDIAKFCGACGAPVQSQTTSPVTETVVEETIAVTEPAAVAESAAIPTVPEQAVETAPPTAEASPADAVTAGAPKEFAAAGSGANPFASMTSRLNSQLDQLNASANVTPFSGTYAKNAEADDIASKARKAAEERAARRAEKKEKTEQRRGKKPVIAGFAEEEEEAKQTSPLAETLPSWDLLPATGIFVDRSAS